MQLLFTTVSSFHSKHDNHCKRLCDVETNTLLRCCRSSFYLQNLNMLFSYWKQRWERLFLALGERCGANVQGPLLLSGGPLFPRCPASVSYVQNVVKLIPASEMAAVSGGGHSICGDPSLRRAWRSTRVFQKTPGPPERNKNPVSSLSGSV